MTQQQRDPSPTPDDSRLSRHRVALTVIADVDGIDSGDPHNNATAAISNALNAAADHNNELTAHTHRGYQRTVQVIAPMPLGKALQTGTLTVTPE